MWWVIRFVLILCMTTAGLLAAAGIDFAHRMASIRSAEGLPENAVVFTGQFDRVRAGLEILRQGRVETVFISGVNSGAGIQKERFATQFSLDPNLEQALASGRLALGERAQNTLENAAETACWHRERGLSGPLLLITSCPHMPRASMALERSLPGIDVMYVPCQRHKKRNGGCPVPRIPKIHHNAHRHAARRSLRLGGSFSSQA